MALGYFSPDVMLEEMTATQLAELEEYDHLEPIGGFREDFRFAMVCDLMFNLTQSVHGKRGRRKRTKVLDWMPWGDGSIERPTRPQQSIEDMKEMLQRIAKRHGTRPRRPGR